MSTIVSKVGSKGRISIPISFRALKLIEERKQDFKSLNTKYVVLGYTELPLLINQKDSKIKLIDTLDVLTEVAFKYR